MVDRCQIKGCFVYRDSEKAKREWQPSLQFSDFTPVLRLICDEHVQQELYVRRELPLAIQELHALALLFPGEKDMPSLGANVVTLIAMAVARVGRLRALEGFLKGE